MSAPGTFVVLAIICGGVGYWAGTSMKSEQLAIAKGETSAAMRLISFREAQIEELLRQLAGKPASAQESKPDEGAVSGPEGAAPPAKSWPKGDPDTEIVETGKPKGAPELEPGLLKD